MEAKLLAGLGEYLRSEREKKQITIEQVASATKINIKLLHALESDNYDALPAKPFIRGFVMSYTRYIGLDHRDVLTRFDPFLDEKSGRKFKRPADAPHIFVEKEGQGDNSKTILTVIMAAFIVGAVVLFAVKPLKRHRGKGKDKAPVTNEEIVTVLSPNSGLGGGSKASSPTAGAVTAPATVAATVTAAVPDPTPNPSPKPNPSPNPAAAAKTAAIIKIPPIPYNEVHYRLIVRAKDDAWVKYQVDDRPLQQYTLKKDKTIFVRARNSIRFLTPKPAALEISRDNKTFHPIEGDTKLIILPKEAESEFRPHPFLPPNPIYLSTPNQPVIHNQ